MKRFLLTAILTTVATAASAATQTKAADLQAYLGLTDTQASALQQIRESERAEVKPLREAIQAKAKAIRQQTKVGAANPAELGQMMIDVQNARQQIEPIRTRAHDQSMAVLTPDQKAKLTQLESGGAQKGRELRQAARLGLLTPGSLQGAASKNRATRAARARKL